MRRLSSYIVLFVVLCLVALTTAACRQTAEPADGAPDVVMTLATVDDAPLVMGPFQWLVTLHDADGRPIDDAVVTLRGDMNHAGMVPVEATAEPQGDGAYLADFEWTMAGEWFVTVDATLSDSRVKSAVHEFAVRVR